MPRQSHVEHATLLTLRIPDFEAALRKAVDTSLASRPVAVVTACKPMGRVVAACPVARAAGLDEGMTYPAARARCHDAAFFLPDCRLAARALHSLSKSAAAYSPQVESPGAGYVLLDTRGTERLWGGGQRVARLLQNDIRTRLRLPAAAGLAVCRPWSLLASRAAGEDGVCLVPPGGEGGFLDGVPAGWVEGLTPRTRMLLLELNIRSLGQLRQFGKAQLLRQFGSSCGTLLWSALHPSPWDAVTLAGGKGEASEGDTVRVEALFGESLVELEKLRIAVRELAARIAATLRARALGAARLHLVLFHADGALKTAEVRTGGFVQDEKTLTDLALDLLGRTFRRRVAVSRLWLEAEKLAAPERQGVLFGEADGTGSRHGRRAADRLAATLDGIHERYGETSLAPAALLAPGRRRPGRRKAG